MRIVFDIGSHYDRKRKALSEWSASGTGEPYQSGREKPRYKGFQVEVFACGLDVNGVEESFEFHGDGGQVRLLLKSMLDVVDSIEEYAKERAAEWAKHAARCPTCKGWVVLEMGRYIPEHGNGHGKACPAGGFQYDVVARKRKKR